MYIFNNKAYGSSGCFTFKNTRQKSNFIRFFSLCYNFRLTRFSSIQLTLNGFKIKFNSCRTTINYTTNSFAMPDMSRINDASADEIIGTLFVHDEESGQESEADLRCGRVILGRTSDNEIQLDSKYISRHHAQIVSNFRETYVEDLNSTNGIFFGNRRVKRRTLKDGDEFWMGKHRLTFLRNDGDVKLEDLKDNVEELEEYYDIEIPREKFDTVGGYLFHLLGNVPKKGEKVSDNGLVLMVEDSDARKIDKVRVWRDAEAPDTER